MELMIKTSRARELTSRLKSALDNQDMDLWLELLDQRGMAMAEFEAAHREASEPEREACRAALAALQVEDRELQHMSEDLLEVLAGEFREQLGTSSQGANSRDVDCRQACLDRKV